MLLPKTPTLTNTEIEELREYSDDFTCGALILEWIAENLTPEQVYGKDYMDKYDEEVIADYVSARNENIIARYEGV